MTAPDRARTEAGSTLVAPRSETVAVESSDPVGAPLAGLSTGFNAGLSSGPGTGLSVGLVTGRSTGPRTKLFTGLRRLADHQGDADPLGGQPIPGSVVAALRRTSGHGQPLPAELRDAAGSALGRDLSPVQVHTGPEAARLTRSVQAVAFTHGHDIYFSAGAYRPSEPTGQRLIAHELGHIGQAESGAGGTIGRADDPAEAAADRAATGVLAALRRQAVRAAAVVPEAPVADRLNGLRESGGQLRRRKVNQDGSRSLLWAYRDTADRDGFAHWVEQLQAAGATATLQRLMTTLHRSDPAKLADHEAVALSLVQRALDKLAPQPAAPAPNAQPSLANLPRADWWKLFIEGDKHDKGSADKNAMRFDDDQSPGYYAAMSKAFQTHVAQSDRRELTFADYDAMHVAVTRDTLAKDDQNVFRPVPHELSTDDVQYPMTKDELPNPAAIKELYDQGRLMLDGKNLSRPWITNLQSSQEKRDEAAEVAKDVQQDHELGDEASTMLSVAAERGRSSGLDNQVKLLKSLGSVFHDQPADAAASAKLNVVDVKDSHLQVRIATNRQAAAAPGEVDALFANYYEKLKSVPKEFEADKQRGERLRLIAQLVRALHVGHFFADANGRLNTMVLLNRLLTDCGFSPVVLRRTETFGGAFSEYELVDQIEEGLRAFEKLVRPVPASAAAAHPSSAAQPSSLALRDDAVSSPALAH